MAVSEQEARAELARRELARRREDLPTISEPAEPPITQFGGLPAGMQAFRESDPVTLPPSGFFKALRGVGEGGLEFLGSGVGSLAGGIAAAPVAFDPEAANIFERVSKSVSDPFRARSREGQLAGEALTFPFQALEKGADVLGDITPGGPEVQTGVKTALLGLPAVLGLKGLGKTTPKPTTVKQQVLVEAQEAGYVTPTSSAVEGSITRGAIEGAVGKPRMQQQASFKNQKVTNELAARDLGLAEGTEITLDVLDGVRREAGQAYSILDDAGTIATDVTFRRDLANSISDLKAASKDFPVLAKADSPVAGAIEMAQGLNKPTFNASSVASVTKILRDEASAAFRNGQAKVGQAYRDMSKAIEDAAEAHLVKVGDPQAVAAFRDARVRIAKSYSIEKALDGDGFVSAIKLKSQRSKREPLTGGLDLAARFAEQFPKSARVIKETPIQTGRLSTILGAGGSGGLLVAGNPALAALLAGVTFGGPAVRAAALSRFGQSRFANPIPQPSALTAPRAGGLLTAAELAEQGL